MKPYPQPLSPGEETLALHLRAHKVPFERQVRLIPGRKWAYDFVIPSVKLAIEVHGAIWRGGAHSRGAGLERDYAKMNAVVKLGYLPLQYSTEMVTDGVAIEEILELISASRT